MHAAQLKLSPGVLSYVPRVINRWFVRNAQNYHRGVVFCEGCGFLCRCVILCHLRYLRYDTLRYDTYCLGGTFCTTYCIACDAPTTTL